MTRVSGIGLPREYGDLTGCPSILAFPGLRLRATRNFRALHRRSITMLPMPDSYLELLDATIGHLEQRKAEGEKWVSVPPETLALLSTTAPRLARQIATIKTVAAPVPAPSNALADSPAAPAISAADSVAAIAPSSPMSKAEALTELRNRALRCETCPPLARSRKSVVFGVGDINAALMFVGEAPGADEDERGEPFVGAAGQLLTKIIKAMGYSREEVYIANVLKCRPDTPGQTHGNRKPTPVELRACLPYLLEQIRIIQPKVIVSLGASAMEGLFGKPVMITKLRGHWQSLNGTPVMPTYHPSYLLRNQAAPVKRELWDDMIQVMEKLGAPITQKQRNFFR